MATKNTEVCMNNTFNDKLTSAFLLLNSQDVSDIPLIKVTTLINESIDNGVKPSSELIMLYYKVMHLMLPLASYPTNTIIKFTNKLFKMNMIDSTSLEYILPISNLDGCYKFFTNINYDHIHVIVNNMRYYDSGDRYTNICVDIISNVILNKDILLELLECKSDLIMSLLIEKMRSVNFDVSQDHLTKACKSLPYSQNVVTYLLTRDLRLTKEHVVRIYERCNCDFLLLILEQTRMVIDKQIFQAVLKYPSCRDNNHQKINVCINAGYVPDVDDVIVGIKCRIEIPDIERFNLILDMNVLRYCYVYDFYPNYTFVNVDVMMVELAKACNRNNMSKIRRILRDGCVPSVEFMDMIVKSHVKKAILCELIDAGGKLSLNGIKNKFDEYDYKLIMGCINDICGDVKKKDELIMLLSGKCDYKIEYDVDKFKDIACVGKYFDVNDYVTFDDVKMLLWDKICKNSWIVGKYIVIPDTDVSIFSDHKYVKICDIDQLVCAYVNCNHI